MSNTINTSGTANILQQQAEGIGAHAPSPNQQQQVAQKAARNTFADFMRSEDVSTMMKNVLADEKKREAFTTSVISLHSQEKALQDATRGSILQSCLKAAVLDLPIDKNLGFAWVIAYSTNIGDRKNPKWVKIAQCQLGYKAFIQFALRTGKYKRINAIPVYEGELIAFDRLTEELALDYSKKESNTVIGYAGYFELKDGFIKTVYWTKDEIEAHRQKFNKDKDDKTSINAVWRENYDAMAMKTVIKSMLNKWGLLTTQLQNDLKVADESERIDISENAFETEPELQLN